MSIFLGATNLAVLGGTYVAAGVGSSVTISQGGESKGSKGTFHASSDFFLAQQLNTIAFKHLAAAAAYAALHDSAARFDAPRCHRNTRVTYLDKLEHWLLGAGEEFDGKHLIWLRGGAGVGKSAIMQSIVERCAQHMVILGTFFFSHSDSSRNKAEVLKRTLAYQLALAFPAAMAVLELIIQRNPLIFKSALQTQAIELLVRPILYLIHAGVIDATNPCRRVFVIDGLDECDEPQKQALIIKVIASILCEHHAPIHFLIASRPELAITQAFQKETQLHEMFEILSLYDNADARADIRQFIEDSFRDIVDSHPMRNHIALPWPDATSITKLVQKSSGHFIYAVTAMKFIASSDEHPARALHVIEGLEASRTQSPFGELDALYRHILMSAKHSQHVLAILRQCYFLTNLGCSSALSAPCWNPGPFPRSPFPGPSPFIGGARFSDWGAYKVSTLSLVQDISPADIDLFLSDIQALVSVSLGDNLEDLVVHPKHLGLEDFIRDEARSQGLYVAPGVYYASLLSRFFDLLDAGEDGSFWGSRMIRLSRYWGKMPTNGGNMFLLVLCEAIRQCHDSELLDALVRRHCPQDIWVFDQSSPPSSPSVGPEYMTAVRDCISNKDNALYLQQFPLYMQFLLDNLHSGSSYTFQLPQPPTRAGVSSDTDNFSRLPTAKNLLGISQCHACYLVHLVDSTHSSGTDHRTVEALKDMPQSKLSWSADLAAVMELVLLVLLCQSWAPPFYFINQHEQWLMRRKPSKHVSTGSPKLACRFYDYGRRRGWSRPITKYNYELPHDHHFPPISAARYLKTRRNNGTRIRIMCDEGYDCIVLLKAAISFLRKADLKSDVAQLARRSLPQATLWFPKLMKRARREMDEYVRRWEESPDGLLENARPLGR